MNTGNCLNSVDTKSQVIFSATVFLSHGLVAARAFRWVSLGAECCCKLVRILNLKLRPNQNTML